MHYLIICPEFVVQRQQLMHGLVQDVPNAVQDLVHNLDKTRIRRQFTDLLIYGTKDEIIDKILFKHVHAFINDSKRFS